MLRTLKKINALVFRLPRRPLLFCLVSASLIILSFPKHDMYPFCWFALVPLFFAIEGRPWRQAFGLGYFTGAVVYLGTLTWLINMASTAEIPLALSVAALLGMALYLSVYYAVFSAGYALFSKKKGVFMALMYPSFWVALEFLRDHLFSGFGWLSLGYSQYKFLPIIQIADMTGVMGVSFLLVLTNVALKEVADVFLKKENGKGPYAVALITIALVSGAFFYGKMKVSATPRSDGEIKVAVVQANIDQQKKWRPWFWPEIIDKHFTLTEEAAVEGPDLIIWPETSFPGYLWDYPPGMFEGVQRFVRGGGIPLLFGAVVQEGEEYFNAAVLLDVKGEVAARYDKMHLVPFGEYLPLRKALPVLKALIPIEDFTSGIIPTLFPVVAKKGGQPARGHFSVLICFEDTLGRLARRLVNAGAGFLVNITNDAWFLDSKEPYLHLQASVFRAVENRRDMVRAANTGISCFIDRKGEIKSILTDAQGDASYVEGYRVSSVILNQEKTFYTKHGDIFAFACGVFFLLNIIFLKEWW